ncbi:MAG: hypothetical protein LWY06_15485 [Firmicutes bacterium]|nr:hypothetical protein [Bacillota bacterium]
MYYNRKGLFNLIPVLAAVFIYLLSGIAGAELPAYIEEQLHKNIKYEVVTERNLDFIAKLKPGTKPVNFVVIQAKPESFKDSHAKAVMDWVHSGGTVWFYDSRLAEHFGMENSPYSVDKIKGQPYNGGYGSGKVEGVNVVASAVPFTDCEIANGLQSIQVFLMEVGKDKFSGVSSTTKGVMPVFVVNLEQKAVVAVKKHGKGWVIFKPLLWPEVLGGERFQANLKEFSAGYSVPKAEKSMIPTDFNKGKPSKLARYDSINLSNGEQTIGMVTVKSFSILGSEGTKEIKVDDIKYIRINETGAKIKLKNDREYQGALLTLSVEVKSPTGKRITLEKSKISNIDFDVAQK